MRQVSTSSSSWGFYGRGDQLATLQDRFRRRRWFFLRVTGRRRIGKTSLVHEALRREGLAKALYIQIPDSDPAGVVSTARDFYQLFRVGGPLPTDLKSLAASLANLVRAGWIVAIDEFQYFHRKALFEFTSHLQAEVDRLSAEADRVAGGLLVLGSIHTEMTALLEDRSAPLYARLTGAIDLPHLDLASVLELLRIHADDEPERLLFLWNLFEGVPKFYRDAFEEDVLAADRRRLLERMFFSSSSPLRSEAESWFLRELRGRYDLALKFIARNPGCTNGAITEHVRSLGPNEAAQVGGYLRVLRERYQMVELLQPIFAKPTARNGRYYLSDNFLRSWLAALATPAASLHFRPLDLILDEADRRLADAEGHAFERLVARLYEERSRRGIGDFGLTSRVQGFWDRGDVELDLVALDEAGRRVRVGTCKRSESKLLESLPGLEQHAAKFLASSKHLSGWRIEKVAFAPRVSPALRAAIERKGFLVQDLADLTRDL